MTETDDQNPGYVTLWDEWKPLVVAWWERKTVKRRRNAAASRRRRREKALEMYREQYKMPRALPPGPVHNHTAAQTLRSHHGDFIREA